MLGQTHKNNKKLTDETSIDTRNFFNAVRM